MKRKILKSNATVKKRYNAPSLQIIYVEMEEGIAAGSATVNAGGNNQAIKHEWDDVPNVEKEIFWN